MSRIHFVGGEKGGVGKSVLARLLAQYYIDRTGASLWAAANNKDPDRGPGLGLLERQRVRVWLNKAYAELDRVLVPTHPA